MNPRIAVITPTKSRLKLLCEAMDSVQSQSFADWEHIIVDDGSDDGTAEELAKRATDDPRIRYIKRTSNRAGANVCRNLGIDESRADLIVFLDSDDLLRPRCLERRVEIMRQNQELDFAVFPAGIFSQLVGDLDHLYHPQTPGDDLLRFLSLECVWEISGPIWRRSFLQKIGRFDESLLSMQDLEMHVRAISMGGRYIYLSEIDHDIRGQDDMTKTSMRYFTDPDHIQAATQVHMKLLDTLKRNGLLTWTRQRALVGLAFGTAESWMRARGLSKGVQSWNQSCREHRTPWHLRLMGVSMLCTANLGGGDGLFSRLVNKWKGWVRFRQEPALLKQAVEKVPRHQAVQDHLA